MFLLQIVVVVLLLVLAAVAAVALQASRDALQQGRRESVIAAQSFANAPGVAEALRSPDPTAVLQPRAEAARKKAGVDFVVVMNTDDIRYTYPYPQEIGKKFVGTIKPALQGHTVVEQAGGPPLPTGRGTAVQAVVPVTDQHGTIVGLVSAGITVRNVSHLWMPQLPIALGAGAVGLVLATAGTTLVSRRLLQQTRGMAPAELARMYEHHDAVLHAVREGVLIIDADGRLALANDEAMRLLDLPADAEGRPVRELGLPQEITLLLESPETVTDEVHLSEGRMLAANKRPTFPDSDRGGSVVTLRDTTELAAVSGRAEVARERLKLLYEAGVRIGTTLDVERTAQELADVAVPQFADVATVDLLDTVLRGWEPTAEGWQFLRRAAISGTRPEMPLYPVGDVITFLPGTPQMRTLQQGQSVLEADLRQAEGWHAQDPDRAREALECGARSLVTAPLQARGVPLGVVNFYLTGDSPAYEPEDLSFAEELVARAAVAIDNARRFTREHAMAVTLQRSLLPRGQPEQDAVEVAWRYLPAESGVGGDWFDVLPLPPAAGRTRRVGDGRRRRSRGACGGDDGAVVHRGAQLRHAGPPRGRGARAPGRPGRTHGQGGGARRCRRRPRRGRGDRGDVSVRDLRPGDGDLHGGPCGTSRPAGGLSGRGRLLSRRAGLGPAGPWGLPPRNRRAAFAGRHATRAVHRRPGGGPHP
jgi:PAS domain-containing protein